MIGLIVLSCAVVNVVPTWKMKTESGSPCPSRVRVPVIASVVAARCTPG